MVTSSTILPSGYGKKLSAMPYIPPSINAAAWLCCSKYLSGSALTSPAVKLHLRVHELVLKSSLPITIVADNRDYHILSSVDYEQGPWIPLQNLRCQSGGVVPTHTRASGAARMPACQETCEGIAQGHTCSGTANGQSLRGASRICRGSGPIASGVVTLAVRFNLRGQRESKQAAQSGHREEHAYDWITAQVKAC